MIKKLSLVLLLSCTITSHQNMLAGAKKADPVNAADKLVLDVVKADEKARQGCYSSCNSSCEEGPRGPRGHRGATGATGPAGTGGGGGSGPTGPQGANGNNGINGTNGIDGINGINGINGLNGVTGAVGPTGPTGATGPASSDLGSFFINPFAMSAQGLTFESPVQTTDDNFANVYGLAPNTPMVCGWTMPFLNGTTGEIISSQFVFPDDMDTTQPVFADYYLLIPDHDIGGEDEFSALLIRNQYVTPATISQTNEFGVTSPATGFSESITTPDFQIFPPTPSITSFNMTINVVTVQLGNDLMTNARWGYTTVTRITPEGSEYGYDYALSCIGIRYTRLTP